MKFPWLLLLIATASAMTPPGAIPEDSVYRLEAQFTDQDGTSFQLAQRRGRPQLVAMFYTS